MQKIIMIIFSFEVEQPRSTEDQPNREKTLVLLPCKPRKKYTQTQQFQTDSKVSSKRSIFKDINDKPFNQS